MAEAQPAPNPGHLNNIPPAIRRQAERAEQLQRESLGQAAPPEPAAQQPAPSPQQPPPQPPQPPQPPPAASAGDPDERVRTAEGRLAVEREKRQSLEAQVGNLNRMVAELQSAQRAPAPAAPAAPPRGRLVTPEEEADYGTDLLAVMGKRARDEVAGEINELKSEIQNLKGQVGQVGTRVAARDTEDVFSELHREVPGWVDQNSDENFIQWLQQPEPFSGIKRHDLLTRAFDSHDAGRVIRFFRGFRAEAAATGQHPGQPSPPPPHVGANGKVPLENYAAPGRAAPGQATAPQGERNLYTRAQIAQFYTDKAAGKWRGRETEAANLESDIFRAGPEGRVVG